MFIATSPFKRFFLRQERGNESRGTACRAPVDVTSLLDQERFW